MKKMLFILMLLVMSSLLLHAGTRKEEDMFEKAEELSYEGQLKSAKDLLDQHAETQDKTGSDDSWDGTSMMLGMIWGAIGTGFFIYGKKQSRAAYLLCGIGLCLLPLFVSSVLYNAIFGTILTIAPFKIEI